MIRPRDLPDSIVAQLVPVSAFLHSLGHKQTLTLKSRRIGVASLTITMTADWRSGPIYSRAIHK